MKRILYILIISFFAGQMLFAGNPDRQGEAGAAELLLNPWAKSAGLHTMGTSFISGVEAMRLNPAGIGRITGREVSFGNTRLYEGAGISLNSLGYAQRVGKNGAFGVSLVQTDFGEIPITTSDQPEGTGGFFSPGFFNMGVGYSYTYENKISVGILFRGISESLPNLTAFGFAIDAGVQYVSGEKDNFKLGISLRNIGSPMQFSGEGLAIKSDNPIAEIGFQQKFDSRAQDFELPSVLNIGASYDVYFTEEVFLRVLGNFTSNAFSRDQVGGGAEIQFKNLITLRGGYKYEVGSTAGDKENLYTGIAAGATINVPISKDGGTKIAIDYAYRTTDPFRGTHNIGIRASF